MMPPMLPGLLAIALYLLATALLMAILLRGSDSGCMRRQTLMIGLAAVVIHGSLLYSSLLTPNGLNLGIAVFPVAAASIGLTMLYPAPHIITSASSWQLDSHILTSLLAYSILGLAVLQAILLAIQDNHLRNRSPGGFIRALPPLQTMESLLFQMIATGFALLTLALVTGALFLEDIFAQHLVHKTTLSIIAWAVFAVLLWGRWRFGWRGRTAIRWTIGGFMFLMLAYFGSKFVLELVLAG